jgi:hypothetical protein
MVRKSAKAASGDDEWECPRGLAQNSRAAIASFVFAAIGSALIAYFFSHVRVDRTHRLPIVTYIKPGGPWIEWMAYCGWSSTLPSVTLAFQSFAEQGRRKSFAVLGLILSLINLFGCCLWAGLTEN